VQNRIFIVAETLWNLFFNDKTFILINDPTIVIDKYYLIQNGIHCVEQGQNILNFMHECSVKINTFCLRYLCSVFWELYEAPNYTVWQNSQVMHVAAITVLNVTTVCNIL